MKSKMMLAAGLVLAMTALPALADTTPIETVEAQALKAWPKLAKRDGAGLTLFHNGQPIAHQTNLDCGADGDCDQWYFAGPIRLLSRTSGRLESYAQVYVVYYEGNGAIIADENGALLRLDTVGVASPDGRTLVTGDSETDDANDSYVLTIRDWTGKAKTVAFEASCKPLKWLSNTRFTVRCAQGVASAERFDGTVSRDGNGIWQLRQTQRLDRETLKPLPQAQQGLKTFTAKPTS